MRKKNRLVTLFLCGIPSLVVTGSAAAQVYGGKTAEGVVLLSSFICPEARTLIVPAVDGPRSDGRESAATPKFSASAASIPDAFKAILDEIAAQYQLDPNLLHAVIQVESGYNARAVSPQGARGLMQLMPDTARRFGVQNLFDPRENIKAGARYLHWLLDLFEGDLELALAAYNAGEQAVIRAGYRIPAYRETIAYVPKVLGRYRRAEPQ